MKRFLLRCIVFATLLVGLLASSHALNSWAVRSSSYRIPDGVTTLIIGDSQPMCAFNPARIPGSVNVCQLGEPLLATVHKLRFILEQNPGIETVVLGFSFHAFSRFHDEKFEREQFAGENFDRYYPLMTLSDLEGLPVDRRRYAARWIRNQLLPDPWYLGNALRRLLDRGPERHPFIGQYQPMPRVLPDDALPWSTLHLHYFKDGESIGPSRIAGQCLEELVELCSNRGVQLCLVLAPLHPEYRQRIPLEIKQSLEEAWRRQEGRPGVRLLNMVRLELPRDCYRDFDHVNGRGAAITSETLVEFLASDEATRTLGPPEAVEDGPTGVPDALQETTRAEQAIEDYRALLARTPGAFEPHVELILLLQHLERRDEAEEELHHLVDRHPENPDAWLRLLRFLIEANRPEDVMANLANAMQRCGDDARIVYASAYIHDRSGQWRRALRDARRAVELDPEHLDAWRLRARTAGRLGQRREEHHSWRVILDHLPGDAEARKALGQE